MRRFLPIFAVAASLILSLASPTIADPPTTQPVGWLLPPITPVHRQRPLLVNYCQILGDDTSVDHLSERLAQWDVLILDPHSVIERHLSLPDIRRINPRIKILAWVPVQGPSDPRLISAI